MLVDTPVMFFEEPPHKHVDEVEVLPEDSRKCSRIIGVLDGHLCKVNDIMGEVFDVVGYDTRYVGRSQHDEADLLSWRMFLKGMRVI